MIIKIAAFSHRGVILAKKLKAELGLNDTDLSFFNKEDNSGNELHSWVKENFEITDRFIFIGALQIAVRLISKEIKSKLTDPAVVAIDDNGNFCIPVLSGHIGSANEFAIQLADILGAQPVITTSTDINHKFAVDVFARKNDLIIKNPAKIKEVSSKLLRGESIGIYSFLPILGKLPDGVQLKEGKEADVVISPFKLYNSNALILIPKVLSLGAGCKKGIDESFILECYNDFLEKQGIYKCAVKNLATIDLKREDAAILALINRENLPAHFYSAKELEEADGDFTPSQFVKSVTGTDNVCERSAKLLSQGKILIRKTVYHGITFAVGIDETPLNIGE